MKIIYILYELEKVDLVLESGRARLVNIRFPQLQAYHTTMDRYHDCFQPIFD